MGKSELEKLREELYKKIDYYGRDSPEVLEISRELDICIIEEIKKEVITIKASDKS